MDNDLPEVTIDQYTGSATEANTITFTLRRVGILDDELTVNVRVNETGSMLASNRPTAATFDVGSSTASLMVALDDDTEDEGDSTVTVEVRSGSGYTPGSPAAAQVIVSDNDHVPVNLSWDRTSITVAERAGTATLRTVATTTKDKQPETGFSFGVEVSYADGTAQSGDYSPGRTTAPFGQSDFTRTTVNGQPRYRATQDFNVSITRNDGAEADETFTANPGLRRPQPTLPPGRKLHCNCDHHRKR